MIPIEENKNSRPYIYSLVFMGFFICVAGYEWHVMACCDQMMMYSNSNSPR